MTTTQPQNVTPLWTLANLAATGGLSGRQMRQLRARADMPKPIARRDDGVDLYDAAELLDFVKRVRPALRSGGVR